MVQTKYDKARDKEKKIIEILKENPGGATPKYISSIIKENPNTVKSSLKKLQRKGIVKIVMRGYYCLVEKFMDSQIFDWNFQNCILTCSILNYEGERVKETYSAALTNYEFEIGAESKQATLRISTEHCINIGAISLAYSMFIDKLSKYSSYIPKVNEVTVSSIEFNKDYKNVRLDGPSCITLGNMIEQIKIYQKDYATRVEHKFIVPIGLDVIFSILTNSSNSIEVYNGIENLNKSHQSLVETVKNLQRQIGYLIDKSLKGA